MNDDQLRTLVVGRPDDLLLEVLEQLEDDGHAPTHRDPAGRPGSDPAPDPDTDGYELVVDLSLPRAEADLELSGDTAATTVGALLERLSEDVLRYVLVSSAAVYTPVPGATGWPIQESAPRRPHRRRPRQPGHRRRVRRCRGRPGGRGQAQRSGVRRAPAHAPVHRVGSRPEILDQVQDDPRAAARRHSDRGVMQWVDVRDAAEAVVLATTARARRRPGK